VLATTRRREGRALLALALAALPLSAHAYPGLGFWCRDLTRDEARELPPDQPLGCLVISVYAGSPAAAAGMLPLDRVVAVNDETARSERSAKRLLARASAAGVARLTLRRGSERSVVSIQPAERLSYLGSSCEAGDTMACTDLAFVHTEGAGVEKNVARGLELLRRSCDAGNPRACMWVGDRLARGKDGPPDPARGVALFDRACDEGYAEACRTLATWVEHGYFGVESTREGRASYYGKGCEAGSPEACYQLAMALEDGDGIAEDLAAATVAYQDACAREHDEACIEVARMTYAGRGVPRDRERAFRLYEGLCSRGLPGACFALGNSLLEDGQGERAVATLSSSCRRGMEQCCCLLGSAFEEGLGGMARDVGRAAGLFKTACDAGHGHACFRLAFLYHVGPEYMVDQGLEKDPERSFALYSKSCDLDYLLACWHVGLLYVNGEEAPLDLARGLVLLEKACQGGVSEACGWIERLKLR